MENAFNFPHIILASTSPRRAEILGMMRIPFEVLKPKIAEAAEALELPLPSERPEDYVFRVCALKAQHLIQQIKTDLSSAKVDLNRLPLLSADTTVSIDQQILGKPEHHQDAKDMLQRLSGRTHEVHTAFYICRQSQVVHQIVTTQVKMMALTDSMIDQYIDSHEPFGKAGAYAIQGLGGCFIENIHGSYTAVMGLPMHEVALALHQFK